MVSLIKYKDFPLKNKPPTAKEPIPLSVESPQEALVPIWNSPFYMTPDEPADPRDCDRYPDSLWCGGFPWTRTPIGIDPSIVLDECNVGIELKPILGWTILPPVQLVYRKQTPECKPKPTPIDPPPSGEEDFFPTNIPTKEGCLYLVEVGVDHWETDFRNGIGGEPGKITYETYPNGHLTTFTLAVWGPVVGMTVQTRTYLLENGKQISTSAAWVRAKLFASINYTTVIDIEKDYPRVEKIIKTILRNVWQYCSTFPSFTINTAYGPTNPVWRIEKIEEYWCNPFPKLILPPPPPPPFKKCDCTMTCCPSTDQNDQLLRSLIKKVDKLSSIVGVDDYPVSLPTSLISKDEGFFGNLIPNQNMDVPSLTRLAAWYIERFDEIMGQWEIPIEIKDSDPSKPGDQPLGVKLPNMAEAIAEIFTLAFQTNLNSETLLNFAVRTAAETVTDKQQNFITYKLLQSMTEWAGYKQKDIKLKMPILFSLGKTRYDEVLNESEIDVACVDFDEKFGLEADLMRFREAVSILQANYKRKVDPNGDVKAQIVKHLLDTFASVNKVNGEEDEEDFKQFLTDVENGFINQPGASNPTEPYGRPYTERPRIRDLTKYEPPTNP